MKTSSILVLGAAAFAVAFILKRDRESITDPGRIGSDQPGNRKALNAALTNISTAPSSTGSFDSSAVVRANILQTAVANDISAPDTLARLQPGYTDPAFTRELTGIPDATRSQLQAQYAYLMNRGGTYDVVNAQAISDYLSGIVSSVWTSGRGGTNPINEYAAWKAAHGG